MADVTQTLPSHWKYVSEGGATIVFSYIGPSNSTYDGMVLRLRKVAIGAEEERTNEAEPDDPIIEYQTKCMKRLFPRESLPQLLSVDLERKWLEDLAELHDVKRPRARAGKDHIDFSRRKGVLATDLIGGNWISVEIKPKWGFLPAPTHLSEETKMIKTRTCRFCMHSYMRQQKDQKYVNNYCPLDLFSGDAARVHKAVDSLWDAWEHSNGGVNNLKIFSRGKAVKPDHVEHMLSAETTEQAIPERIRDVFRDTLCNTLLQSPVLTIISKLQRTLDVLDIEGLSGLWRKTESHFQEPPSHEQPPLGVSSVYLPVSEPTISDWVDFLDLFQSSQMTQMDHTNPKIENLRYYMLAYLLSATLKDCSIIVRLDFLKPEGSSPGAYPISVIDLDPKGLDRLQRWEELDREIVSNYAVGGTKICVDSWAEMTPA